MKFPTRKIATKIICTIGPSSSDPHVLARMIKAGMDVARINFSHGTYEEHSRNIRMIRTVSQKVGWPVAILQDLPGPKLRVGKLPKEPIHLKRSDHVILTIEKTEQEGRIPIIYPDLPKAAKKGDLIYLADGTIAIEVEGVRKNLVEGRVLTGGDLVSGKGVNIPKLGIRLPAITDEDAKHLRFGMENDVDIVAVSFVQTADDIKTARRIAERYGRNVFIIAKIEKREAVQNLGPIVQESDGVMVARGDLGVELKVERVPVVQKMIIQEANRFGKPVITATQMLESMLMSPTPTRAEVTDTANAIIDGTDGLMLAEETAVGKYPVEAVEVLSRVAEETERFLPREISGARKGWSEHSKEDALALAACETATQVGAKAIVAPTRTGKTARRVSKYRPPLPIIAMSSRRKVQRQLLLSWGVHPIACREFDSIETIFREAEGAVVRLGMAGRGDRIAIVAGDPKGPTGGTEIIKIQTVGRFSAGKKTSE